MIEFKLCTCPLTVNAGIANAQDVNFRRLYMT
jgi:hypothetical protein